MMSNYRDTTIFSKVLELDVAVKDNLDKHQINKIIHNSSIIGSLGEDGITPLHIAQHERFINVSKLLLSYGVDFTLKNSLGSTALHAAVERAYEYETYTAFPLLRDTHEFADLILSAHIKSKNFYNPCNNYGISHFHAACTVDDMKAVKFFLDHGVSVNQAIDVNSSFLPGFTALHIAVKYCSLKIVPVLLQYNADVYATNSEGLNPVHMCTKQKIESCKYMLSQSESIKELVKRKLEISDQILCLMLQKYSPMDGIGLSHLHMVCAMANSSLANHLLEQPINVDHSINMDSSALHFALACNIDTVKLLVAKGANMHFKDSNERTPFDLCLQNYKVEQLHSILSCHPVWKYILLVDRKTKLMDLIYALKDLDQFKSFTQNVCLNFKKALIPSNSPLWPGYTLLHLVITLSNGRNCFSSLGLIDECLKKSAMGTMQDSFGSTPLHLAVQKDEYSYYGKTFTNLWDACKKIVNPVDKNNLSHLHILCTDRCSPFFWNPDLNEELDLMRKLLLHDKKMKVQSHIAYKGPTINGIVSGSTPLHLAVLDAQKTKILMEYGADIYAVDAQGLTPIHRLIASDNCASRRAGAILLSTPDLKDCVVSGIGLSHLHVASHLNDVENAKKLLDRGADINLRISPELPDDFSFLSSYAGFTPLRIAVSENCDRVVQFLVRHGADVFIKKNIRGLPLIYKIFSFTEGEHLAAFAEALENNYVLQKRFIKETGLTMFHVACHKLEVDSMKQYLQNTGADVNSQARKDSPIWPGFTALHILIDRMRLLRWDCGYRWINISDKDKLKNNNIVDGILNYLLNGGADVTIPDLKGNTPLHLFFQKMTATNQKTHARVSSLLKAQKDFSHNPTNSEGTSHFHVACTMNDSAVVQQFLKHGVDVNKPNKKGNTSLHLSAGSSVVEFSGSAAQLKTIDRLLKCGAELGAENNVGNTPLHEAAAGSSIVDVKVFERLLKAGADPNSENSQGVTPLEFLCKSQNSSVKHFKLFIKRGSQINAFNPKSKEGFIGLILNSQNPEWESVWQALLVLPDIKETDKAGRSVIHNVVSLRERTVKIDFYPKIIEQLVNVGCHIDAQDERGETALHRAVNFSNYVAVFALLEAGADINIVDKNGKTALAHALNFLNKLRDDDNWLSRGLSTNQEQINKILLRQVSISLYFRLHVCQINKDLQTRRNSQFFYTDKSLFDDLNQAKDVKIGESLTVQRFLSEKTIVSYPYTTLSNRIAIRAFVNSIDNQTLKPVIKLVFRKAEMRIDLVKNATHGLRILSDSPVPEVCSRIIFECLKNADLENLITAAFDEV